jgi:hypothetical protein
MRNRPGRGQRPEGQKGLTPMTEVEFSRLLSELTATAKILNDKSDSINEVIKAFSQTLREINLGLTVWLTDNPITSKTIVEEIRDEDVETGAIDTELGFMKWYQNGAWGLATRQATYAYETDTWGNRTSVFKREDEFTDLLEGSRKIRIEAIKRFPELVALMTAEAKAAVQAIETAKKLVK